MQNVGGIKKWNYEKLPLNVAMQFPFPFLAIPGNNNVSFPFPKCGNEISIPVFREREWDIIPGNDREWERELHRKIEWKFFIIPLFNPTNILHCNRPQICS